MNEAIKLTKLFYFMFTANIYPNELENYTLKSTIDIALDMVAYMWKNHEVVVNKFDLNFDFWLSVYYMLTPKADIQ
jgi:hypothetical protein